MCIKCFLFSELFFYPVNIFREKLGFAAAAAAAIMNYGLLAPSRMRKSSCLSLRSIADDLVCKTKSLMLNLYVSIELKRFETELFLSAGLVSISLSLLLSKAINQKRGPEEN